MGWLIYVDLVNCFIHYLVVHVIIYIKYILFIFNSNIMCMIYMYTCFEFM